MKIGSNSVRIASIHTNDEMKNPKSVKIIFLLSNNIMLFALSCFLLSSNLSAQLYIAKDAKISTSGQVVIYVKDSILNSSSADIRGIQHLYVANGTSQKSKTSDAKKSVSKIISEKNKTSRFTEKQLKSSKTEKKNPVHSAFCKEGESDKNFSISSLSINAASSTTNYTNKYFVNSHQYSTLLYCFFFSKDLLLSENSVSKISFSSSYSIRPPPLN